MRHIDAVQLTSIFKEKDFDDRTIIAMAASTGNIGIFNTVLSAADDLLSKTEVRQSLCLTLMTNIIMYLLLLVKRFPFELLLN